MSQVFRKRLKVPIACDSCRLRKVKCDGARPVCGHCAKKESTLCCSYTRNKCEEEAQAEFAPLPTELGEHGRKTAMQHIPASISFVPPNVTSQDADRVSLSAERPTKQSSASEISTLNKPLFADSMNGIVGEPSYSLEVFGNSSAGSFMRQIKAAIDARLGTSQPTILTGAPPFWVSNHENHNKQINYQDSACFTLPPRRLADRLMQAYWDLNWVLYPFINRSEIEADYQSVWSGGVLKYNESLTMCILNTCFALGSQYSDAVPLSQRRQAGEDFFCRAQGLYGSLTGLASLETIQCLLLMGIYLQSTSNVHQCWMTVGQAIRMAQSIGLHLPQYCDYPQSVRQREYARRVWHGCVLMDRVLSMTFGRPGMIPRWLADTVPLPAIIDDEFLDVQKDSSVERPDGRPSVMAFSVKCLELYDIMNDILLELYMQSAERKDTVQELGQILRLDERLHAWKDTLPVHLQISAGIMADSLLRRQAFITRIRFLHVRILLFRPIIARFCVHGSLSRAADSHESIAQILITQCSLVCFKAAHELIDLFNNNLDFESLSGPFPAWWYSILYLYTAATVILAERLRNNSLGLPPDSHVSQAWENAILILRTYRIVGETAERCVAALEILSAKIPGNSGRADVVSTVTQTSNGLAPVSSSPRGQPADWEAEPVNFEIDDMIWLNTMSGNLY
ncbi:fungal-specific transcription factor domain-containing protein [Lipomyces kononenkoae]|uniref:Fungal-specific transcription factor domain-containing protein n=1 Tax=Lipomyces kononenkoae TaxID=34357 RepID=A0ACC3SQT0_LIPKO